MNDQMPEATITIPVDPYNPGEFFACCGLLELAHRLTVGLQRAEGWFVSDDSRGFQFLMHARNKDGPITLEKVLAALQECSLSSERPTAKEGPVTIGEPISLSIDLRSPFPQSSLTKTFAGQQNLFDIVHALHDAVREVSHQEIVNTPIWRIHKSTSRMVTAFATQKAENVIDAGFSMDTQAGRLLSQSPIFLELLALIGTQRFCPAISEHPLARIYYTWHTPLTAPLAAVAVSNRISGTSQTGFIFHMYKRDPKGRYKGFAPARNLTE